MKLLAFFSLILFTACSRHKKADKRVDADTLFTVEVKSTDTLNVDSAEIQSGKLYRNARFKNVIVRKTGIDTYRISGEGQIFEASFNWVIEDGHSELKSGYATTDAGAPAWGKFDFLINAPAQKDNTVLHLIIFETSAQDGRRQHELSILLR